MGFLSSPHDHWVPEPRGHYARMAEPDVAVVNALLDAMRKEATAVVRAGAGVS